MVVKVLVGESQSIVESYIMLRKTGVGHVCSFSTNGVERPCSGDKEGSQQYYKVSIHCRLFPLGHFDACR